MHFRIRKKVVQLVRMTYDPGIKRGRAEVVGSVPIADPLLPDELRERLTDQELAEFDVWLATERRAHLLRQELAALGLAEQMDLARQWLEEQHENEAAAVLAEDWQRSWKALRKTLIQRISDT